MLRSFALCAALAAAFASASCRQTGSAVHAAPRAVHLKSVHARASACGHYAQSVRSEPATNAD